MAAAGGGTNWGKPSEKRKGKQKGGRLCENGVRVSVYEGVRPRGREILASPDRHCNLGKASVLAPACVGWGWGGGETSGLEPPGSEPGGWGQLSAASLRAGFQEILSGERALTLHAPAGAGKRTRRRRPGVRAKAAKVRSAVAGGSRARWAALATTERP